MIRTSDCFGVLVVPLVVAVLLQSDFGLILTRQKRVLVARRRITENKR
jgi:hypothetical protein